MNGVRSDIQALRGLAVLYVVLHHAGLGPFAGGYLGVDVFFVISGYLITRLVAADLAAGRFSFRAFYLRRARRLLPAAYATFLATMLAAPLFLTGGELDALFKQLVGALTFTANIALWQQTGYFDGAARLKPLLHIWSLSLEEQYYLLLPAVLFVTPKAWRLRVAFALLCVSGLLCAALGGSRPGATFYLLPTRAWELGIGSVAALYTAQRPAPRWLGATLWPALGVLLVLPVVPLSARHPGVDALLVCLATACLIVGHDRRLCEAAPTRWLGRVGDMSYAWYLVHWPVFAFLNNAYLGTEAPWPYRLGAFALTLVLGVLLYRFVETPLRHATTRSSWRVGFVAGSATLALVGLSAAASQSAIGEKDYAHVLRSNVGLSSECVEAAPFTDRPACRSADRPELLVWGDSFAMHLVPGVAASAGVPVMQATRPVCGPFTTLAPLNEGQQNAAWAHDCMDYNAAVLRFATRSESVKTVVLASLFGQYLGLSYGGVSWRVAGKTADGALAAGPPDQERLEAALRTTVAQLRAAGKRVVVVAPPPSSGFDIGRCLERRAIGKVSFGGTADCSIEEAAYRRHQAPIRELVRRLRAAGEVEVFDFDAALCRDGRCDSVRDGVFLYRDEHHLSYAGSEWLGQRLSLGAKLIAAAR